MAHISRINGSKNFMAPYIAVTDIKINLNTRNYLNFPLNKSTEKIKILIILIYHNLKTISPSYYYPVYYIFFKAITIFKL